MHWQRLLPFKFDRSLRQFVAKAFFVSRFQKSRPKRAMNFNASTNDALREFVKLCVSASLRLTVPFCIRVSSRSNLLRARTGVCGRAPRSARGRPPLPRRHGDDENTSTWPSSLLLNREKETSAGWRREHQLKRHVDHQQIARMMTRAAQAEQHEAHEQIMMEADVHLFEFLFAHRITPTIATSRSTETISNGSVYCVNKSLPSA